MDRMTGTVATGAMGHATDTQFGGRAICTAAHVSADGCAAVLLRACSG